MNTPSRRSGAKTASAVPRPLAAAGLILLAELSFASNTAGVFGPVVNEGHRSAQYRIAYDADSDALAQRIHYQQAINGDLMWRVIAQGRKTEQSDLDFDFFQGELFWQLDDFSANWRQGVRFDLRLRDEGRPGVLGLNWTHEIDLATNWQARLILLSALEVGDGAADGVLVQTRASLAYAVSPRYELQMTMYSAYGSSNNLAGVDEQFHQLGPTVTVNFDGGWQLLAGYLAGLTDATPDNTFRLWLGYRY